MPLCSSLTRVTRAIDLKVKLIYIYIETTIFYKISANSLELAIVLSKDHAKFLHAAGSTVERDLNKVSVFCLLERWLSKCRAKFLSSPVDLDLASSTEPNINLPLGD